MRQCMISNTRGNLNRWVGTGLRLGRSVSGECWDYAWCENTTQHVQFHPHMSSTAFHGIRSRKALVVDIRGYVTNYHSFLSSVGYVEIYGFL